MSGTRMPGADQAIVAPGKVRDFLLAPDHKDNKGRADFFVRFGFTPGQWAVLRASLATHPMANDVVRATVAGVGSTRYRVRCSLPSPDGRSPCVTTVWIAVAGEPPRFITAFPGPPSAS